MSRNRKVGSTRDAILDAAVELFVHDGFKETSMDAIANEAELAKGSLYYHFESKEGILDAILERYRSAMEIRLAAIEADPRLGALEKLLSFAAAIEELNSATFTKLHRIRYIDIHQKTLTIQVRSFAPYFARVMEEGTRSGFFRVTYPLEFGEILIASAQALLDPEVDADMSRRVAAFCRLVAMILGVDVSAIEQSLGSVMHASRGDTFGKERGS